MAAAPSGAREARKPAQDSRSRPGRHAEKAARAFPRVSRGGPCYPLHMVAQFLVIVTGGALLLAPETARSRGAAEVRTLGLDYRSSHGCSQSFASTSFRGRLELTRRGQAVTLVLSGKHHYSMGPSLGRFRQSGGRDKTHHTASTIRLSWTGTARIQRDGALLLALTGQPPQCKTDSGYLHTTQFACSTASPLEMRCHEAQVPVYPAEPSPGSGAYPAKTERPVQVKVLRCVPLSKNLGLLGELPFESGLPLATGAGLVLHHGGMHWRKNAALRFPGKRPP